MSGLRLFYRLLYLLSCSLTALCALGGCDDFKNGKVTEELKEDRTYGRQVERLLAEYSVYEGTYSGDIVSKKRSVPVTLQIAVIEVDNGVNRFGNSRSLPKLTAILHRLDAVEADIQFSVRIDRYSGEISFVSLSEKSDRNHSEWYMNTRFAQDRFTGEIRRNGAVFGRFVLARKSLTIDAPTEQDEFEQIRSLLRPIEGRYTGRIPFGDPPPSEVGIEVYVSVAKIGRPDISVTCSLYMDGARFGTEGMTGEFFPAPAPGVLYVKSTGAPFKVCPMSEFRGQLRGNKLVIEAILMRGGRLDTVLTKSKN